MHNTELSTLIKFWLTIFGIIFLMNILSSCGFDLDIKADPLVISAPDIKDAKITVDMPTDIKLGPDFEGVAKFCDDKYLPDLEASEACFRDYRDFYQIKVGLDLDAIIDFCGANYDDAVSTEECIEDLISVIDNALGNSQDQGGQSEGI